MAAATQRARELGPELGLLFCWPDLIDFYQQLGWHILQEDVRVDQPGRSINMPTETMWQALREHATIPTGPVRLFSLPM
jgi:hypothetical protein